MAGKMKCDECGVVCGHGWRCSKFPVRAQSGLGSVQPGDPWYGYRYTDEHIPTERLGVPTAPAQTPTRCECGSGSNEASGAHSHWCPRWVRP